MKTTYYFDNAATTFPKPEAVYTELDSFYRDFGVNVGRGQHKLASIASNKVEETRNLLLNMFHCQNNKVVFTPTATEAINLILRSMVQDRCIVYVSPFEHNAVMRTLHAIGKQKNIDVCVLPFDLNKWQYDYEQVRHEFSTKSPDVVIMSHASNVCGFINPFLEIFELAKKYQAVTVLDMCQTAGLIDTDLSTDVVSYAIFDGHKTLYGPLGVAGVIGRHFNEIEPLIYGGTGIDSANIDMPDEAPSKFEAGSINIQAIAGLNAALKWIEKTDISQIHRRESENRSRLLDILKSYRNIDIISPCDSDNTVGVVSCVFKGFSSDNIGNILSTLNIAVRTGLHCSPMAHQTLGTFPAGTVRFSVGYFNDDEDFEALERALEYIDENS